MTTTVPRLRAPWSAHAVRTGCALLLLGASALAASQTDALPRRARLGAQLTPTEDGTGLNLLEVFPDTTLAHAGARSGDVLLALDEMRTPTFPDLGLAMDGRVEGDAVVIEVRRGDEILQLDATMRPRPKEQSEGIVVEYGSVSVGDARLRTLVTRPREGGPFPALMVLQGLGCFTIDGGDGDDPAFYRRITHELARRGFLTLRVEKSSIGDSSGTPCSEIDFETEGAGYQAALRHLLDRDDVARDDIFLFGHSMGGIFAPWLANRIPVRGLAVYGTGVRNWQEYMHDNMRRQMLLGGGSWAQANDLSRRLAKLMAEFHVEGRPLPEIMAEHPEWSDLVEGPEHYAGGRHWTFFQQLGELNAPALWEQSGAHGLAIYGAADYVSFEEDHRAIAEIVNRVRPDAGRVVVLDGMDHLFREAADFADAQRRLGTGTLGDFDPRIIDTLSDWMTELTEPPAS